MITKNSEEACKAVERMVARAAYPECTEKDCGILRRAIAERESFYNALFALTEWGRTHTSPTDPNSPHELLIQAVAALEAANKEQS